MRTSSSQKAPVLETRSSWSRRLAFEADLVQPYVDNTSNGIGVLTGVDQPHYI